MISIEVKGLEEVTKSFAAVQAALGRVDVTLWPLEVDAFRELEEKQFATAKGWTALSPRYVAWKSAHAPGRSLLVLTGKLRSSLTTEGEGFVAEGTKHWLKVGTRDPKAIFHQEGTSRMPARPIIQIGKAETDALRKVAKDWLVAAVKKAF